MPIIPWNDPDSGNSEQNTASSLLDAAKSKSSVSTATPIKGFEKRTKSQNEQYRKGLKQRREQTKLFAEYIKLNLLWQKEDLTCTKVLTQWRVGTFRNITKAGLIVARGAAAQQVIGAQGQQQFAKLQESTAQRISDLQQNATQRANERLRR